MDDLGVGNLAGALDGGHMPARDGSLAQGTGSDAIIVELCREIEIIPVARLRDDVGVGVDAGRAGGAGRTLVAVRTLRALRTRGGRTLRPLRPLDALQAACP